MVFIRNNIIKSDLIFDKKFLGLIVIYLSAILILISTIFISLILFSNLLFFVPLNYTYTKAILFALIAYIPIVFFSKLYIFKIVKKKYNNIKEKTKKLKYNSKIGTIYIKTQNFIFYFIKKHDNESKLETANLFETFIKIIKAITSLDYFMSDVLKDRIVIKTENYSKSKAQLIKYFNWLNLVLTLGLAIFMILKFDFWELKNHNILGNSIFNRAFLFFIFIRSFSRSLEIIYAFYGDVATRKGKEKTTNLDRYDRLSLAVTSYIEMIISYSIFYYMWAVNFCNYCDFIFLDKLIKSIGIMTFSDFINCDLSVKDLRIFLFDTAVSLQVITSIVLIIFAVASYLSEN